MKLEMPVLGKYGKAIPGSASLNFCESGTQHCETACRHHPESTAKDATRGCYAVTLEQRHDRKELKNKLRRHYKMGPARVVGKAILELQDRVEKGKKPPWIRLSTDGSVPPPEKADALFIRQLRTFLTICRDNDIPVHFPVESYGKRQFYHSKVGDLVCVRVSLQNTQAQWLYKGPCSWVAGTDILSGPNILRRRIDSARFEAKRRYNATGRKSIYCPAIFGGWFLRGPGSKEKRMKMKCGNCVACANPNVDVVYAYH